MKTIDTRQGIISTILDAFQEERSIYGAYHLLKGKKSAQTIQDGSFFSILSYFGLFPKIRRSDIEADVQALIDHRDATWIADDRIKLTDQGKLKLKNFHLKRPILVHIKGWHYHEYTETVWLRFCLFLQVLTHLVENDQTFYPLTHQTQIQNWVKKQLPRHTDERKKLLAQVYNELLIFLSTCHSEQAMIFVHQLSGKAKVGLTRQQLAEELNIDYLDLYLYHISTLHQLFATIENDGTSYPVLSMFTADMKKELVLTASARQTLQLLNAGHSIEAISKRRKLKQNTIEDHIVEIAIQDPQFSVRAFVNYETEMTILDMSDNLQTSRLRVLKDKLPSDISYFVIRLVLARKKVENGA